MNSWGNDGGSYVVIVECYLMTSSDDSVGDWSMKRDNGR